MCEEEGPRLHKVGAIPEACAHATYLRALLLACGSNGILCIAAARSEDKLPSEPICTGYICTMPRPGTSSMQMTPFLQDMKRRVCDSEKLAILGVLHEFAIHQRLHEQL